MPLFYVFFALLLLVPAALLYRSSQARQKRLKEQTQKLALLLRAHPGTSRWSPQTAFFEHESMLCGVYLGEGVPGACTGVVFRLESESVPEDLGSIQVFKKSRSSLSDYAEKGRRFQTGDAGFDQEFQVVAKKSDHGFVYRWLDGDGRKLVRELTRFQGPSDEARVEYISHEKTVRLWGLDHVTDEVRLRPLLEVGARLSRKITGKSAEPEPAGVPGGGFEV